MPPTILILYDGQSAALAALAEAAAQGVAASGRAAAVVKPISAAGRGDLLAADGLLLGAPNWSGVSGAMKQWLDSQGDLWEELALAGRPGAAFTAGLGQHSGLEMTLLQLIHWMLAGGMLIVGLPWSERMRTSGSYYGATAAGGVTPQDREQARALGRRLAETAARLA